MQIRQIQVDLLLREQETPIKSAVTAGGHIATIACRVVTEDGLVGNGYGWAIGADRGRLIAATVQGVARLFIGDDPRRTEAAWDKFWKWANFLGHSGLSVAGMSILDLAFWDIRCKSSGQPLHLALGGHKPQAQFYASQLMALDSDGRRTIPELVTAANKLADRGFTHVKLRFGIHPPAEEVTRVRTIVSETGGAIRWLVDIAQRWDAQTSLEVLTQIDDLGLYWMEDPAPFNDNAGIGRVAARLRTPICTGENHYNIHEVHRSLQETGQRFVMPDLMRCGGISGWTKIAALAEAYHVQVVPHVYPNIAVHLICGTSNSPIGEYMPWWDDVLIPPTVFKGSFADAPTTPGIGVEFIPGVLESATESTVIKA